MINAQDEQEVIEEETYETDTSTEDDGNETEESEAQDVAEETVTISKSDYEKIQRGLARKARLEGKSKKDGQEGSKEGEVNYDQDLIARTYLAAQADIVDVEVQDEALRLADKFGLKIDQAMRDPDISTRLKNLQKQKQTQASIAGNGGVNTAKPRSVDQYVSEFNKTGKLPDDPRLVSKILDALTKK